MTLCFQLHRAVGGNKDERPYVNRLGSWCVPAQTRVLTAGMSRQHPGGAPGPRPTLLCSPGVLLGATHLASVGRPVFPPVPSGRAGSAGGMGWALVPR